MARARPSHIGAAAVLALAGLCAACGTTVDPGYVVVTQDKFDFMPCREIVGHRAALASREKELSDLAAKAEAAPGGIVASLMAYRTELASVRTQLSVARNAAAKNGCEPEKR